MTQNRRWLPVAVAAAAALGVAMLGGSMTQLGDWYHGLRVPSWKPPDWLFGPAWTVIFALCAASGAIGWNRLRDLTSRTWLIGLFALNGVLNLSWSILFFTVHRPDWAMVEVVALWLSILALIAFLWRGARLASWLLIPYLAWVSLAGALNLAIVRLNGPFGPA